MKSANNPGFAAPAALCPGMPPSLSDLVVDCVQPNPAERPESMMEIVRRLGVVQYVLQRLGAGKSSALPAGGKAAAANGPSPAGTPGEFRLPERSALPLGTPAMLFGYKPLALLGEGAGSAVYVASDPSG